jgi:hypothetical protein
MGLFCWLRWASAEGKAVRRFSGQELRGLCYTTAAGLELKLDVRF